MMTERIFVDLKPLNLKDSLSLIKCITEEMYDLNFSDLIDYMVDFREDDLNPGYDQLEREVASNVSDLMKDSSIHQGSYLIHIIDNAGELAGPAYLHEKLNMYLPFFGKTKTIKRDNGETESFDLFEIKLEYFGKFLSGEMKGGYQIV